MRSHWDLGKRPSRQQEEAAYKEVSTFDTPKRAADKAQARDLGEYIALLDVPDAIPMSRKPASGHVGLIGTTPDQLLGYVRAVHRVDEF